MSTRSDFTSIAASVIDSHRLTLRDNGELACTGRCAFAVYAVGKSREPIERQHAQHVAETIVDRYAEALAA